MLPTQAVRLNQMIVAFEQMSFPEQLIWLMENGIRPEVTLGGVGKRWTNHTLAEQLYENVLRLSGKADEYDPILVRSASTERNIINWRNGASACRPENWRPLELVFFGDGTNRTLHPLRMAFRRGMQTKWESRKQELAAERYAMQITSETVLQRVYDFDETAYVESDRNPIDTSCSRSGGQRIRRDFCSRRTIISRYWP